jgi:hypothetical protein
VENSSKSKHFAQKVVHIHCEKEPKIQNILTEPGKLWYNIKRQGISGHKRWDFICFCDYGDRQNHIVGHQVEPL